MVYRQDTGDGDIAWAPTDGTVYTTSTDVTGVSEANLSSAKIIYVGTALSTTDVTSLEDNKTYQYKIFSRDSGLEYTSGVQRLSRTSLPKTTILLF